MLERFLGEQGKRHRVEAFSTQKLVGGDQALATELADVAEFLAVEQGAAVIEQDALDNDIYFIIAGKLDVVVNATVVQQRSAGVAVGEMAAIDPTAKRAATVVAAEDSLVARVTEPQLSDLGARYPDLWRRMAKELAERLRERNRFVSKKRDLVRVLLISSAEAIPVTRALQDQFAHDPFVIVPWHQGVFRVTFYTLTSLESELEQCDFAIAIAHTDDVTTSRGVDWPAPRDNVIFELGLAMGKLGLNRAILMEPRGEGVKLPSDMKGITTIPYVFDQKRDTEARFAPACNELRKYIQQMGPRI
ncbi:CRP/FNR family cyclic AMP-dependent transcriptional regulator [Paraburkholderia sp. WC7.3g]|uniref:Cyclic nucleotide-binding domain-containing protein n=1 Tax=Paraburkholderia podalyriae TaxID=1938811 RepID=A0ABR7PIB2_9BURK|nr:TIR domain-containing protein [Paraburkholderia podalyriae]MBC8745911.1 cyclic nucleotide-binding domain-containing protein [Paraburkholderia podalyriae]